MSQNDSLNDYGANDWLIDEMRERYQADPSSVDQSWVAFFEAESGKQPAQSAKPTAQSAKQPAQGATKPAQQGSFSDTADATPRRAAGGQANQAASDAGAGKDRANSQAATAAKPSAKGSDRPESGDAASKKTGADKQPDDQRPAVRTARAAVDKPENKPTAKSATPNKSAATQPQKNKPLSADAPDPTQRPESHASGPVMKPLKSTAKATAKNMDASLAVPTATSVRTVPMKLVIDNRELINAYLRRSKGGKVSFTHILGYAMVQALKALPDMNNAYAVIDGKPTLVENHTINLGLAIDVTKSDGTRQLVVPSIKDAGSLDFAQFWSAYEDIVARGRKNALTMDDYTGTTASLTNPGGIGTNHSVPRLMNGQGVILGVGSIDYPAEYQGDSQSRLNELGIGKVTTLTSTYDHRVIQGAVSGEFLKVMNELLRGEHDFFDEIFASLRIPYAPYRWARDISAHRTNQVPKSARVVELVMAYRQFGHIAAAVDPLAYNTNWHPDLELATHGLTIWDLDREFAVGNFGDQHRAYKTLRELLAILRDTYCHTLGIEYMHIANSEERHWFQQRFEKAHTSLPREEHLRILDKLNEAEIFETFLQTKFIGQKRFSLEGGESAIVLLDEICDRAANDDLYEVVIGMPHRGRLNVLANIVGKKYGQIFKEFEGNADPRNAEGTGDVKYHLGAQGTYVAPSGKTIRASVAANPSHLEAVDPVLEGIVRAKQDQRGGKTDVLPLMLHGDASFAGQGVVYEVLQMSQLRGYRTGGTIHLVVNNQVGFTTSPHDSRTSHYCTDVAKAIDVPVLHVNGDDPDACVEAARLAFEYREQFGKDVVIDLVCYRRRGHNEGDDPSFTQPNMYDLIEQKRSTRKLYTESLIGRGDISVEDAENVMNKFRARLEAVFKEARNNDEADDDYRRTAYYPAKSSRTGGTAITQDMMDAVARAYSELPESFAVHHKVLPQLQRRAKQIEEGPIDWSTAEILAFGSLLLEGRPVRLTGQDSRRGTFSQRFASIVDRNTNEHYLPLRHLSDDQASFEVWDSMLSEYAVMGFEYGYSVARPDALVLWEAQYGDFANGAQIVADEFISSANAKWTQKSGVVLLLPHGYEGSGPDHSSARLERWLQLCSENALAVCQPSTAASHFHLLRQHAYVNWHRPLVIATPKSMLRSKQAASQPSDFLEGKWEPALDDPTIEDPSGVEKVLLCSGKLRWELVNRRAELGLDSKVAIVSLERLYPLPDKELAAILARYRHVDDVRFVQDEPENQGSWPFMALHLAEAISAVDPDVQVDLMAITRPAASAPSVGGMKQHKDQEAELLDRAFGDPA